MLVLELGCGREAERAHTWEGGPSVKIDLDITVRPDVVADVVSLPFSDNCADAILASHILEHLPYKKAEPALEEWYRVLKSGGKIRVLMPDLKWQAQKIIVGGFDAFIMVDLFGGQDRPGQAHLCGLPLESLKGFLSRAGFHSVSGRQVIRGHGITLREIDGTVDRRIVPEVEAEGMK